MDQTHRDFSRGLIGTFVFAVACIAIGFAFGEYLYDRGYRWVLVPIVCLVYFVLGFTTRWWGSFFLCLVPVVIFTPIGAPEHAKDFTDTIDPIALSLVWGICLVAFLPAWAAGVLLGKRTARP